MGLIEEFEARYWSEGKLVMGLDEAGRGPMAGPCVVAGVVLPIGYNHPLINDSKKLSEKQRLQLYDEIIKCAIHYEIFEVSVEAIERYNILQATRMGMEKVACGYRVDVVLADAMDLNIDTETVSIIKGDARSISIAAASILAKTYRDRLMVAYAKEYPEYGFDKHKGYGTKYHKEMILKYGRCPIHRKDFRFKDEFQISLDI
jgi:ribonuclease HII